MKNIGYASLVSLMAFTSFLLVLVSVAALLSVFAVPANAQDWLGLKSDEAGIEQGQSVNLMWNLDDGESPRITPSVGAVGMQGEVTVKPDKTTTYVLTSDIYEFGYAIPVNYEITITVVPKQ